MKKIFTLLLAATCSIAAYADKTFDAVVESDVAYTASTATMTRALDGTYTITGLFGEAGYLDSDQSEFLYGPTLTVSITSDNSLTLDASTLYVYMKQGETSSMDDRDYLYMSLTSTSYPSEYIAELGEDDYNHAFKFYVYLYQYSTQTCYDKGYVTVKWYASAEDDEAEPAVAVETYDDGLATLSGVETPVEIALTNYGTYTLSNPWGQPGWNADKTIYYQDVTLGFELVDGKLNLISGYDSYENDGTEYKMVYYAVDYSGDEASWLGAYVYDGYAYTDHRDLEDGAVWYDEALLYVADFSSSSTEAMTLTWNTLPTPVVAYDAKVVAEDTVEATLYACPDGSYRINDFMGDAYTRDNVAFTLTDDNTVLVIETSMNGDYKYIYMKTAEGQSVYLYVYDALYGSYTSYTPNAAIEDGDGVWNNYAYFCVQPYISGYGSSYYVNVYWDYTTSTGITSITNDIIEGSVEYYNLQGVRVMNPTSGLYIIKEGTKVSKRIIR
ncbi:MAG: hypothetical protein LIO90_04920 [Bacteroidales bacterium]|nr:hypothetical protein [Bacteroidales bacterium]